MMSAPSQIPPSPLKSVLNFRDVGRTINALLDGSSPVLKASTFYRSARPDEASPADRHALTDIYKIRTIIDLRSKTEHLEQAKRRDANIHSAALASTSDSEATATVRMPGVKYVDVNLNGGSFSCALLWKLQWGSLLKLLALMAAGYRLEAISILGREVMAPRGLIGLGKDSLDYSKDEIRQVFEVFADDRNYPVLVHCTQGKDRTGLVVLLLLLLLDTPVGAISADYVASEKELKPELNQRMKEINSIGLGEDFAACPSDFVQGLKDYLDSKYGGFNAYLDSIGVKSQMRERIKTCIGSQ